MYVCNKDYILHGDSTRECGQDGLWSGQVPQCQFHLNSTSTPTMLGTFTTFYSFPFIMTSILIMAKMSPLSSRAKRICKIQSNVVSVNCHKYSNLTGQTISGGIQLSKFKPCIV